MPALTTIAVNPATDTLTTATPHGLLTGDRTRVRNVGGALPAPLVGATDMFAIMVDATNLKLATSNANANAGIAIDITTAGTGTQTIEYGLPYCVPRIAAAGVQIKPGDDNAAWQALVALYGLLTGQPQTIYNGVNIAGALAFSGPLQHSQTWQHQIGLAVPAAGCVVGTGNSGLGVPSALAFQTATAPSVLPLVIPVGTITAWSVRVTKVSASGTVSAKLLEGPAVLPTLSGGSFPPTQIGALQSNSANASGDITLGQSGLSFVMTAGRAYFIEVYGGGITGDGATAYNATVTGT